MALIYQMEDDTNVIIVLPFFHVVFFGSHLLCF